MGLDPHTIRAFSDELSKVAVSTKWLADRLMSDSVVGKPADELAGKTRKGSVEALLNQAKSHGRRNAEVRQHIEMARKTPKGYPMWANGMVLRDVMRDFDERDRVRRAAAAPPATKKLSPRRVMGLAGAGLGLAGAAAYGLKQLSDRPGEKKAADFMDEGWNDPPSPQSRKIPKRPKNAAWKYDSRLVWDI